jgi:hypothetical protein
MANLKVRSLMNGMIDGIEESEFSEVPYDFPLIGRNGYYCRGEDVWFEYQGRGYLFGKTFKAKPYFQYDLVVNDEAILMEREARAMETILKTSRDSNVRKAISARLRIHEEASELRDIRRGGYRWKLEQLRERLLTSDSCLL